MTDHVTADGERDIAVGRDVISSIIITGDHNRFFIGDYERLRDAYIEPWSVLQRVDLDHFVGREWLLAQVDAFLRHNDRGYFILEADAGLGKTAFLAWLTRQRGYIHHFAELAPGLDGVGKGLKNLAAQLVLAYHLNVFEVEGVLPGAAARPDYLVRLLRRAADQCLDGEKIVLVIDALDEAGTPERQNVLGLPSVLPEGVFVIVSQRPVPVALQVDTANTSRQYCQLVAESSENQTDMRRFVEHATTWPGIVQALERSGLSLEQFTSALSEKSRGVWIYVHYVLHEIDRGERSPLDLEALPDGMTQYYASYWQRWRDDDEERWYEISLPLLATLAAAREGITAERLADWANVRISVPRLRRLLDEGWRPFLAIDDQALEARYRFYHATLREFFCGHIERERLTTAEQAVADELRAATKAAHHRLVERYFSSWGGFEKGLSGLGDVAAREVDEGYGLRHLTAHLEASGRFGDLDRLLSTETAEQQNSWYMAKDSIGDVGGYVADVTRAWSLAESAHRANDGTADARSVGLQLRYALIIGSLNSLAWNIPPQLMAALVEARIWTPAQAVAHARQVPEARSRVDALSAVAPCVPLPLRDAVLNEALGSVLRMSYEESRAEALADLVPRLPHRLRGEAAEHVVRALPSIGYGLLRSRIIATIASYLPDHLLEGAWTAAMAISDLPWRIRSLAALAPHLPGEFLRGAVEAAAEASDDDRASILIAVAPYWRGSGQQDRLREALLATRRLPQVDDNYNSPRAVALALLAPTLSESLVIEALDIVGTIQADSWRAEALAELAPQIPEFLADDAMLIAHQLPDFDDFGVHVRTRPLCALLPRLPRPLRGEVLSEALQAARELPRFGRYEQSPRADALSALAPHLASALEEEVLREALSVVLAVPDVSLVGGSPRAKVLALVAARLPARLPASLLEAALEVAGTVRDAYSRAKPLGVLAPCLPTKLLRRALDLARGIGDQRTRVRALVHLASDLSEPLLRETLAVISDTGDVLVRTGCLVDIVPHLPPALRTPALREALAASRNSAGAHVRSSTLKALAPYVSDDLAGEALGVALMIESEYERSAALVALASCLPECLVDSALTASREISPEGGRSRALCALAVNLGESSRVDIVEEALKSARGILDPGTRAKALFDTAHHLVGPLKHRATEEGIEALNAVRGESVIVEVVRYHVAQFLNSLGSGAVDEVLDVLMRIQREQLRSEALAALAPSLPESLRAQAVERAWFDAREVHNDGHQASVLSDVAAYLPEPLLQSTVAVATGMRDEWQRAIVLKTLVPYLPRAALEEALVSARAMDSAQSRVEVLTAVASQLPEHCRTPIVWEALRSLRDLAPSHDCAEKLSAVVPRLPPHDRLEVMQEVLGLASDTPRRVGSSGPCLSEGVMADLWPGIAALRRDEAYELWCRAVRVFSSRGRPEALRDSGALRQVIALVGGQEAVGEAARAILDVARWWP